MPWADLPDVSIVEVDEDTEFILLKNAPQK